MKALGKSYRIPVAKMDDVVSGLQVGGFLVRDHTGSDRNTTHLEIYKRNVHLGFIDTLDHILVTINAHHPYGKNLETYISKLRM